MTQKICRTCSAYQRINDTHGTCRAKPPVAVPQLAVRPISNQPELQLLSGWPPVAANEWCRPGPEGWQPRQETLQ